MLYRKTLFSILTLVTLVLTAPAQASEFTAALDGNLFNTSPLNDQNASLGARVGAHAALDITLFSSQFDWRLASSFQPLPASDANFLIYGGPQLRLSPGTDTPYIGVGLGAGLSATLIRQGEAEAFVGLLLPFKGTLWAGYRFADPGSGRTQSVEGYGTIGLDGLTVGLRWGLKL